MNTCRRGVWILFGSLWLLAGTVAPAQLPQTVLLAVSPMGGQAGTQFEVKVTGGTDLEDLDRLTFSHPGITARPKMIDQDGEPVPSPDTFVVRIGPSVSPGLYEVRCGGIWGDSNPRRFVVGNRPELTVQNDQNSPQRAVWMDVNSVINSYLKSPHDVDWYRFFARKGDRLVVDCWAERIDSRLDGVISLYDSTGKRRLAMARHARGDDPALIYDVPADGEYLIQLHDLTYRGGPEFGYRLEVHTGPYLEVIDPPSGTAGVSGNFNLYGYNLPGSQRTEMSLRGPQLEKLEVSIPIPDTVDEFPLENRVSPLAAGTDAFSYRFQNGTALSNPLRIGITALPVEMESSSRESPQTLHLPVEVGGAFQSVGDVDEFRFEAVAGQTICIDVFAQRMGSAADPVLILSQVIPQADGSETFKQIAAVDDQGSNLSLNLFETKTDDPSLCQQIPETGTYQIRLRDRYWEARGGINLAYRLSVRPIAPDFRIVCRPASTQPGQVWPAGLRKGENIPLSLYVFRQDGFQGPIRVFAKQLPPGLSCPDVVLGADESLGQIVLTANRDVASGLHEVELAATAVVHDSAALEAVTTAQKDLESTTAQLTEKQRSIPLLAISLDEATRLHQSAVAASSAAPDDQGLKQQVAERQQELTRLQQRHAEAEAELTQLERRQASVQVRLQHALEHQEQAVREVTRRVRPSTVIWSHRDVHPAIGRLTDRLMVSVMEGSAPYQLLADVHHLEACQGRELQIPVSLYRQGDFDKTVEVTAPGVPTPSLEISSATIDGESHEKSLRLFVGNTTPPGTYTLTLRGDSQVDFRRNLQKVERVRQRYARAKEQTDASRTILEDARRAKEKAAAGLNAAYQKRQQAQNSMMQRQQEFDAARAPLQKAEVDVQQTADVLATRNQQLSRSEQGLKDAQSRLTANVEAITLTDKQLGTAMTLVESATQAVAAATTARDLAAQEQGSEPTPSPQLQEAEQKLQTLTKTLADAVKAADAIRQSRDDLLTANHALKGAHVVAEQNHTAESTSRTAAVKLHDEARARLKVVQQAVATAEQNLQASQANVKKVQAELMTAENAFAQTTMVEQGANETFQERDRFRGTVEQQLQDAEREAEPRTLQYQSFATPIVLTVKPAPIKLTAKLPSGAELAAGSKLPIEVEVTRQNGFAGPVTLSLVVPESSEITPSAEQQLSADQSSAVLFLNAKESAAPRNLQLLVRGKADVQGPALVDAPLSIIVRGEAP